ncbi:MAG TPA: cysteine desulfurase family protein [Acidimicrobiales bacterium]|nr:cysteine desulfurase family protein [Acidimicrobiales bacterium]
MPAYFDHAATVPLGAAALEAMEPWLHGRFGNPSGSHAVARAAAQAVDEARDVLGTLLGTAPGDVVFTGSGTESCNLAILGRARAQPGAVVVSAIEHQAVLRSAQAAGRFPGVEVRYVPIDKDGGVDCEALVAVLDKTVSVVSVQLANNEVGTIQPLSDVARIVRRRSPGAVLHTDAVQAAPWLDVAALSASADLVSVSAHKFGGPQGVGALALRRQVQLEPLIFGGPQERGRRAGTHNVAGIVGMAAALLATARDRAESSRRVAALRDELLRGLLRQIPDADETASGREKLPGHCHLVIQGIESEALLVLLDGRGIAASAGSACASGAVEPSHVLLAMGYPPEQALGTLRLTLGHSTTAADVQLALEVVPGAVARLRGGGVPATARAIPVASQTATTPWGA